jgi:hypothetical protein
MVTGPVTEQTCSDVALDFAAECARTLITAAETGALDAADPRAVAQWIGQATAVMKELTRNA